MTHTLAAALLTCLLVGLEQSSPDDPSRPAGRADPVDATPKPSRPAEISGLSCDPQPTRLCLPLDGSFSIVDFNFGMPPCERNDDGFSDPIQLPFTFELFGTTRDTVYINNNGTLSFDAPFPAFAPNPFPLAGPALVAPFWSDVDTRGGGGAVWMRLEPNRLVVIWERVGYFNMNADRLNTFEVILTDGSDPAVGLGNNVCLSFDDMEWTTGDASGGFGGFGGSPATVGVNLGDGLRSFQVGLFDQRGMSYDGPGGANDGVDFLDGTSFAIDVSAANVPPIFEDSPTTYTVPVGTDLDFEVSAFGPEVDQNVSLTVDAGGLAGLSCALTGGPSASAACTFSPVGGQEGLYVVTFTATDDGVPPASSTLEVMLVVEPGEGYCFGTGCPCGNDSRSGGCANSTGTGGLLGGAGTASIGADDLVLTAGGLPANRFAIFFTGSGQECTALGDGRLAVLPGPPMGGVMKFPIQSTGAAGSIQLGPGLVTQSAALFGAAGTVTPGSTWNYQVIYRDRSGPCGSGFSLSNGYAVTFAP